MRCRRERRLARVLRAGGGGEAFAVVRRIKAARPNVYPGASR
jgi:hypothetical protein